MVYNQERYLGVRDVKDVVSEWVCSSDPKVDIHGLQDVEAIMKRIGFGRTERFDTREGAWLRFYPTHNSRDDHTYLNPKSPPVLPPRHRPQTSTCQVVSEHNYDLKLPIHLNVQPEPEIHFRPFIEAVQALYGKPVFHLRRVDCESYNCRYLVSCRELYGYQKAPSDYKQY